MVLEKLGFHTEKWNWTLILHHSQNLTQDGFKDLHISLKVLEEIVEHLKEYIKLLKENIGSKLLNIGFVIDFQGMTPKAQKSK